MSVIITLLRNPWIIILGLVAISLTLYKCQAKRIDILKEEVEQQEDVAEAKQETTQVVVAVKDRVVQGSAIVKQRATKQVVPKKIVVPPSVPNQPTQPADVRGPFIEELACIELASETGQVDCGESK